MIDGGKAQLGAAAAAMHELDLEAIPMIGVVKPPRRHNEVSHLLVKGREHEPVFLDSHSPVLRLIQMIRDETHRTAVQYHRKRRELRDFTSELTAIPGVGEKRKNRLLRNLGSIQRIANATVAELSPFVGRKTAEEISEHFTRQRALAESGQEERDAATRGRVDASGGKISPEVIAGIIEPENIETRLDDPEGDAADLQPIRSLDQTGRVLERRKSRRKRTDRSSNPHTVKRQG
jgi:UvrC RIbonuclease H-like domain/Helix-hairpin-helix domain